MNLRDFFYNNYSYQDNYIPPYVNYLLENTEFDKLEKVLIVDFLDYRPSIRNTAIATMDKIYKYIHFIIYFFVFIAITFIFINGFTLIPMCLDEIIGRINGTHYSSVEIFNLDIPVPIFMISMLAILALLTYILNLFIELLWIKKDMYTFEKRYINKIIKSKEKKYNKLKKNTYFL